MKKIKVLHLTTHLNIGGITSYIFLLGRGIDHDRYELNVLSSGGEMTSRFRENGIKTFEIPFRTKSELSPKLYRAIPKVIRLIREEKIDLLHAHTRVTQVMAWWIQKLTGVPYVSTCHGFYKRRLGRLLLPAWGECVIAISEPVADWLSRGFHVPEDRISTILNAIDIQDLEARTAKKNPDSIRAEWKLRTNAPVIGIVSRIVEDKGHEYLLRAVAALKDRYPHIKLLVVGEGPFQNKLKQLSQSLDVGQNATFIGTMEDVTKALAVIDIFVLPAVWREGFGLSIVEAMALRKPVIVTNIWALNALVHDHINGLLIPPKDVESLARAIVELIENQELREKIGLCAYETVKREFSIDRIVHEIGRLYEFVVDRKTK